MIFPIARKRQGWKDTGTVMKEKKNRVIILAVTLVIFVISFLWNTPEKKTLRYFNSHPNR